MINFIANFIGSGLAFFACLFMFLACVWEIYKFHGVLHNCFEKTLVYLKNKKDEKKEK